MPAPKKNVAGNIVKAVVKQVAKKVAKKPVVKIQPKPNLKANPKSNVKVVSSGKSPQKLSEERQYLKERAAALAKNKTSEKLPTKQEILNEYFKPYKKK